MNNVKPIIRMYGTKYKLLKYIFKNIHNDFDYFFDVFGGSGIVGVNVANHYKRKVVINDYDCLLNNLDIYKVINNQISFNGRKGTITKSAIEQFKTKIRNGFWNNYLLFKEILEKYCLITNMEANDFLDYYEDKYTKKNNNICRPTLLWK